MRFVQISIVIVLTVSTCGLAVATGDWKSDPIWHDGLVEKAVYSATRTVYGKPREYEAIFFTNKEQHDARTLTKAEASNQKLEVWKHNQVETIPTPNYEYHYVTTTHLAVESMELTRLDCSSQEFCGTSFKQYLRNPPVSAEETNSWSYWSFSYLPEAGRSEDRIEPTIAPVVAADSLPLWLRGYDFSNREPTAISLLPSQKSNAETPSAPISAEVICVGEDGNSHKIEIRAAGETLGTYWMSKDAPHVMTKYVAGDGSQTYELTRVERVNYWTRSAK